MKISKKNLRKIILENLFQENNRGIILESAVNLNKAWRAASKFKNNPSDDKAREELERFKTRLQDNKDADPPEGPFRKNKGRAQEAQALLDDINALLDANPGEAANVELKPEPEEDPVADDTGGDSGEQGREEASPDDPKIYNYPGDTAYDYKVNQETGCWMARKGSNGNWFSMKGYKENMWNLDDAFPNARTDEQKERCPNKKPGSSPAPESNESSPPEPGTFLKFKNSIYRYDTNGGHVEYFKDKGYRNFMLNQPGEPALVQVVENSDTLVFIGWNGLQLIMSGKASAWMGHLGAPGEAQTADHYQTMKKLYNDILESGQVVEAPQGMAESLSRGSLLRRRYWGRY